MFIKVKRAFNGNKYTDSRLTTHAILVFIISVWMLLFLNYQIDDCRSLIYLSNKSNVPVSDIWSLCNNIPLENCRCSIWPNESNISSQCLTDVQVMAAHILPLVSYVLQLYLISKLFWFIGKYRHILTDIFWIVAIIIFIFIATAAHGSNCLRDSMSTIICLVGTFVSGFAYHLIQYYENNFSFRKHHQICRKQRLVIDNHDYERLALAV